MALEDASTLSNLLSRLSHPAQLPLFLSAFQTLRHARATRTQGESRLNQFVFHLDDGAEQEKRDRSMREGMRGEKGWRERLKLDRETRGGGGTSIGVYSEIDASHRTGQV